MKTVRLILALTMCATVASADFYNTQTEKTSKALPTNIPTKGGFIGNPSKGQLEKAGWLMAEIVPFVTPEGYVKIAGSRRFDVVDAVPYEKWDTETVVAKQHADQAAKPQKVKDREKTAKDLIIGLGFSVPVPQDELDTMLPALLAQVQTLLANNKTKEAVAIMANVQALMALWSVLGEDIHAPFLGEGGNPE